MTAASADQSVGKPVEVGIDLGSTYVKLWDSKHEIELQEAQLRTKNAKFADVVYGMARRATPRERRADGTGPALPTSLSSKSELWSELANGVMMVDAPS